VAALTRALFFIGFAGEMTTQYLSDEDWKIMDAELGEFVDEVDVIISSDLDKKRYPPSEDKKQPEEPGTQHHINHSNYPCLEEEKKTINKVDKPNNSMKTNSVLKEEVTHFVEKFRIKQCPNYSFYLQKTDKIPSHISTPKYLSKNFFEKVVLTSYPRSGNTLLRKYLEDITGIITGSDWDVKRKLNNDLIEMGMLGEGKVGSFAIHWFY
jgi:hypothetical protein